MVTVGAWVTSTFYLGCLAEGTSIELATSKILPSRAVGPLETTADAIRRCAQGGRKVARPSRREGVGADKKSLLGCWGLGRVLRLWAWPEDRATVGTDPSAGQVQ